MMQNVRIKNLAKKAKTTTMEVFPDSGCQESLVSGDLISPLGLVLDQKRKKRIRAVNGAKVSCLGSTSFQITYDGQTTNVLALVTTALSKEIVLSWRALQRLKVLPEDFPRAQTTVKANQVQSTTKIAITAKDASKDDTVDLQESM